jgi:hypothetical protein
LRRGTITCASINAIRGESQRLARAPLQAFARTIVRDKLSAELRKAALQDRRSGRAKQREVEMQVMQRDKPKTKNFLGFDQMADVRA